MVDIQDYGGPDRRLENRRQSDMCMWHEAHEVRFEAGEKKTASVCHSVGILKDSVDKSAESIQKSLATKVPMKLFYGTAVGVIGLIFTILAFQWGTYEKVNTIAIKHTEAMGTINISIVEVKAEIESNQRATDYENRAIKTALESNQKEVKEHLDKVEKTINKLHNGG